MGESPQESEIQPQQESVQPSGTMTQQQERLWATFCHLGAFAGIIAPGLGHILGPLVVWLIKRNESAFVDDHGKEALNFQLSVTIYGFVAGILCLVLIGFLLIAALIVFDIIVVIMGAVKANSGETWQYPLCIRFIK